MEFARFNEIVNRVRTENPFLFELGHDAILSEAELSAFERENKFQLSNKYKQFLLRYGGGYFGYAYLYSLDRNSDFYLLNYNCAAISEMLYVADNGCGDFYAQRIVKGQCEEKLLFYEHETGTFSETTFNDVLEYLVEIGLKRSV